jgi:hypothetical protein
LNPFRVVWELIGVLIAMAGVHIEVRSPEAVIYVRVI